MNNQNNENREHCKSIAKTLEAYAGGSVYRCPKCGAEFEWINENYFVNEDGAFYHCPNCGAYVEENELEALSIYDYLEDVYDIEYRVGSNKEYRSARIMVACGGPNIYIDTKNALVQLYWWTEYAEYPFSYEARNEIDNFMEELFQC
ncbi:MAG: hypothetical protein ACI4IW_06480 [Oscillospiraceae bacterium]